MKYLLDTNICIYYLKGQFDLDKKFAMIGLENFAISEITFAELLYGAEKSQNITKNLTVAHEFVKDLQIIPISSGLKLYAREKARLRAMGRIISDLDLLIASTAVVHDRVMVTRNVKEFERIENIVIQNWVDDFKNPTLRDEIYKI